jgi:hypothetical protein
LIGIKYT